MVKRKSAAHAGQVRKLRRVQPGPGEQGPVPVYVASRLQPEDDDTTWAVDCTGKEPKVTGELVSPNEVGYWGT